MSQRTPVFLHDIATSVPRYRYSQSFALEFMLALFDGDARTRRFLEKLYPATAIEHRHTVVADYFVPPERRTLYPTDGSFQPEPGTRNRNELFASESDRLSVDACRRLFDGVPGFDPGRVTHLVTHSCTGFAAPGFDFHLVRDLELRRTVHRFHLGFMGCYAAFPALKLAKTICDAEPDARVLVVGVELCSLHFQQKRDLDTLVANALFSDGVHAALVSGREEDSEGPRFRLDRFVTQIIDKSEKDMAWMVGETGFDMKLSAYVPALIQDNIGALVADVLDGSGAGITDIDLWAIHPGGRAILDRARETLALRENALDVSYEVLRDFGNMSSVTIMFVLERILRAGSSGSTFACAFGPGLTVEGALLEKL